MDRGPGLDAWIRLATWRRSTHCIISGGMPAALPCKFVAITDWGRKHMDVGFKYPIPAFPQFLLTPVPDSHQDGSQVPVKPSQVHTLGGDVRQRSREARKWMVAVLQFWGDKASTTNGIVYGGT